MDRTQLVINVGEIIDPDQLNESELREVVRNWLCDHYIYIIRTRRGYRFVDPHADYSDCVGWDEVEKTPLDTFSEVPEQLRYHPPHREEKLKLRKRSNPK
jgi:hypothetical protein